MRKDKIDDLASWAGEDRGCGAQVLADALRRREGGEADALRAAVRWREEGRGVVLATVVESTDSAFGAGVRAAFSDDGLVSGSLGDPGLEQFVSDLLLEALREGAVRLLALEHGEDGDWRLCEGGNVRLFVEPIVPAWEVVVIGSGRVPTALCGACAVAGIPFRVYDAREDAPEVPGARETVRGPWDEVGHRLRLGVRSFCVVATPHHEGDPAVTRALLSNPVLPYVGLMNNVSRATALVRALRAAGIGIDARFHCPVGLSVATQNQGQIALAILAEVLAVANGTEIRPMGIDWERQA